MSQSHVKAGLLTRCFLWERGASVGCRHWPFFLTFKVFYMHKNIQYRSLKGKGKKRKKHNRSPLIKNANLLTMLCSYGKVHKFLSTDTKTKRATEICSWEPLPLTVDHHNLISSPLSPNGRLSHICRNSLQVSLRYHTTLDGQPDNITPPATAIPAPRHKKCFPALSMALSYKTTRLRRKHYMAARPTFRMCFSTSPVSSLSLIEHITCTRLLNAIPTDRTSNTGLQIVVEHGSFRTWDCATVVSTSF